MRAVFVMVEEQLAREIDNRGDSLKIRAYRGFRAARRIGPYELPRSDQILDTHARSTLGYRASLPYQLFRRESARRAYLVARISVPEIQQNPLLRFIAILGSLEHFLPRRDGAAKRIVGCARSPRERSTARTPHRPRSRESLGIGRDFRSRAEIVTKNSIEYASNRIRVYGN